MGAPFGEFAMHGMMHADGLAAVTSRRQWEQYQRMQFGPMNGHMYNPSLAGNTTRLFLIFTKQQSKSKQKDRKVRVKYEYV